MKFTTSGIPNEAALRIFIEMFYQYLIENNIIKNMGRELSFS